MKITQTRSVHPLLRRFLIPWALGSIAAAALFLGWILVTNDIALRIDLAGMLFALTLAAPFQAVGLILLLLLAALLRRLGTNPRARVAALAISGPLIGMLLVLPMAQVPFPLFDLLLPAACGGVGGLIWLAFNRDMLST
jgi:hypothetical protein